MRRFEIKPSIVGGIVSLIPVLLGMKKGDLHEVDFWKGGIVTVLLGVFAGYLIERLIEKYNSIRRSLEKALTDIESYSVEMHREVHSSTLLLCSIIGIPNSHEPVQEWAIRELVRHFEKIPTDNQDPSGAREVYCPYLRKALEAAGGMSTWLGIHEDKVSFFTANNHRQERVEYISTLNRYSGKKYRIFVEGQENRN